MSAEQLAVDDLLAPIAPDQPAGTNLRWLPEWDRIREARQSEDGLGTGKWAKKDPKSANWLYVQRMTTDLLRERSKDLQLALWLTEASLKLRGFAGLQYGLQVTRELVNRFWDAGLFPVMEDGPEDRTGPFEWLNDKVVDSILAVPITRRSSGENNYGLIDLRDARLIGSEKQCEDDNGDVDPQKRRKLDEALAAGRISLDMFKAAVQETPPASFEELASEFEEAKNEFKRLEKIIDEKFSDVAPNLGNFRGALQDIGEAVTDILNEKRRSDPSLSLNDQLGKTTTEATAASFLTLRLPLASLSPSEARPSEGRSWQAAEHLIRSGRVDAGLAEMRHLAAAETTGRSRFERKLLLAEVCLRSQRERLARVVLEELAAQIDKHQLDTWESSELIGSVWTRLYEMYQRSGGSDADEAAKLFERLCRLDPWQALSCTE